jgi:NAD(P)-dependent dehydrogenase (short-subunit alcohol dehydrogenase family)
MRVAIVDGQGGGIGKLIVEKVRRRFGERVDILALGTNALATAAMLKAGANEGASGENAIVINAPQVDVIMGSHGIVVPNAMLGELTPKMAEALAGSWARKILLPLNRSNIDLVGVTGEPLPHLVDEMVSRLEQLYKDSRDNQYN